MPPACLFLSSAAAPMTPFAPGPDAGHRAGDDERSPHVGTQLPGRRPGVRVALLASDRRVIFRGMRRSELLRASPPMFKSPWLDRLSRVHPSIPVIIFAPAIVGLFAYSALHMSNVKV